MSVELYPEELGFRRPFNHEVTESLKITNTNKTPIAFKVKTTAPKQYCVRPNSGVIRAEESVEVSVLLQAMKEDPPLDARCRDKFLVQSTPVTTEDDSNVTALWQTVEKTNKAAIQERKIRVHFLPAGGAGTGAPSHDDQPPAYTSPSSNFAAATPADAKASRSIHDQTTSASATPTKPAPESSESGGISGAAAAVVNAVPTSQDQLQQQLADARAQISKLSSQIQDPQFRQRKVQEASEKVQTVVQQTNDTGVPLQIVAGLCLLSFLIAYLFF